MGHPRTPIYFLVILYMPRKPKSTRKTRRRGFPKTPYGRSITFYNRKKYAMYRSPRPVFPQEYVTTLRYSVIQQKSLAGILFNWVFYQTAPFDVDPVLGNTAMPGLTELAAIYARVRPLRISYRFDVCNNEAEPLHVSSGFTSEVLVNPDVDVAGNPLWKTKMLAAKGGMDKCTMKGSATIVQIAGTKQALFDDLYTSSTTTNNLAAAGTNYAYLVCEGTGVGTAAGFTVNTRISLTCQFYRSKIFNT